MADVIQLLPDSVANQIAAGEVVQRPASVVKELMENALDAGATKVQVILKNAGKGFIQVIDDGKGMSPRDSRMAFERHATSKISCAQDLFNIRTMGFRGEALASIASVAEVELRTKREEDELGTYLFVADSELKNQENIDKTKELLTKYGLIDFINSYPQELSGGMRQRIALIRTLATNPQVLLLDEPFSALDYQTRINVSEDIFKMIKDSNVSAILVTHDISEAIAMADRVIVLSHRPAKLKKIIDIKTDSPDNTPFNKRLSSEFRKYFDEIWGLLNE